MALSPKSQVGHCTTRKSSSRSIGRVSTIIGEGRGQLDRRRAREVLNACTRESKGLTRGFLGEKLISDHGLCSSYESQQGAANGQDSWGVFQGCTGLWTAGRHRLDS